MFLAGNSNATKYQTSHFSRPRLHSTAGRCQSVKTESEHSTQLYINTEKLGKNTERFCRAAWCSEQSRENRSVWFPTSEYWCIRCRLWGRTCRCRCSRRSRSPRTWTAPLLWSDASWRRWRSPRRLCSRQRWSDHQGSSRCWCSRLENIIRDILKISLLRTVVH